MDTLEWDILYSEWSSVSLETSPFVDLITCRQPLSSLRELWNFLWSQTLSFLVFSLQSCNLHEQQTKLERKKRQSFIFRCSFIHTDTQIDVKIDCLELLVEFHLAHKEYDSAFTCQIELLQFAKRLKRKMQNAMLFFFRKKYSKLKECTVKLLNALISTKLLQKLNWNANHFSQQANEFNFWMHWMQRTDERTWKKAFLRS